MSVVRFLLQRGVLIGGHLPTFFLGLHLWASSGGGGALVSASSVHALGAASILLDGSFSLCRQGWWRALCFRSITCSDCAFNVSVVHKRSIGSRIELLLGLPRPLFVAIVTRGFAKVTCACVEQIRFARGLCLRVKRPSRVKRKENINVAIL
jgi:hypothetical protein